MLQTNLSSSPYHYNWDKNGVYVSTCNDTMPEAFISINKNRIKHYKDKIVKNKSIVYLKDKTNFELELFNPTCYSYGIKITFNGIDTNYSKLIIRPGQRIYLDRFLDDNHKFIYNTYEISNNEQLQNAIKGNGNIEISFYREKVSSTITCTNLPNYYTFNDTISHNYSGGNAFNSSITTNTNISQYKTYTSGINTSASTYTIETGRIERGEESAQKFNDTYLSLNSYPDIVYSIKILPVSQKNVYYQDIIAHRNYCHNCGKKVKAKDKFCSNCGTKL